MCKVNGRRTASDGKRSHWQGELKINQSENFMLVMDDQKNVKGAVKILTAAFSLADNEFIWI